MELGPHLGLLPHPEFDSITVPRLHHVAECQVMTTGLGIRADMTTMAGWVGCSQLNDARTPRSRRWINSGTAVPDTILIQMATGCHGPANLLGI